MERRNSGDAAGLKQKDQSTRAPSSTSTKFKFTQSAVGAGPPARDASAGVASHRKPRGWASAGGNESADCDIEEETVRIAAGSARMSPEKRQGAGDSRKSAVGSESGSCRRSSRDTPPEDW